MTVRTGGPGGRRSRTVSPPCANLAAVTRASVVVLVVVAVLQLWTRATRSGQKVRSLGRWRVWAVRDWLDAHSRWFARVDLWAEKIPRLPGVDKRLSVGPVAFSVVYGRFYLLPHLWVSRQVLAPGVYAAVILPGKRGVAICRSDA